MHKARTVADSCSAAFRCCTEIVSAGDGEARDCTLAPRSPPASGTVMEVSSAGCLHMHGKRTQVLVCSPRSFLNGTVPSLHTPHA